MASLADLSLCVEKIEKHYKFLGPEIALKMLGQYPEDAIGSAELSLRVRIEAIRSRANDDIRRMEEYQRNLPVFTMVPVDPRVNNDFPRSFTPLGAARVDTESASPLARSLPIPIPRKN